MKITGLAAALFVPIIDYKAQELNDLAEARLTETEGVELDCWRAILRVARFMSLVELLNEKSSTDGD